MFRTLTTVALILVVAACGESVVVEPPPDGALPDGPVTVSVLSEDASPAGIVQLRFANAGPLDYLYNACERSVERQAGDGWVSLPPELRVCTAHLDALAAGASRSDATDVPADAVDGTYRFAFRLWPTPGGDPIVIRSGSFEVR